MGQYILKCRKKGEQEYSEVRSSVAEHAVRDMDGNDIRTTYARKEELADGGVTRVGTSTVGSDTVPVFLKDGRPRECTGRFVLADVPMEITARMGFTEPLGVGSPTAEGQAVPTDSRNMVPHGMVFQTAEVSKTSASAGSVQVVFPRPVTTVVAVRIGGRAVGTAWSVPGGTGNIVQIEGIEGTTGTVSVTAA